MKRETKFKFVIDNKHLSKAYTLKEILDGYDEKILEDMEVCDCTLTEGNPSCEGGCSRFENSTITGQVQFTGLKDNNGKDIYEGDICKAFQRLYEIPSPLTVKIIYNEATAAFEPVQFWKSQSKWIAFMGNFGNYTFEVIGNIYETPELINEVDIIV